MNGAAFVILAGILMTSGVALSETLRCANYFDIDGSSRIVFFEGTIKDHDHIPDVFFILDPGSASIEVRESGEGGGLILESNELERIHAESLREVLAHKAENGALYALDFDRSSITMKIRYASGKTYIESSVKTSNCEIE